MMTSRNPQKTTNGFGTFLRPVRSFAQRRPVMALRLGSYLPAATKTTGGHPDWRHRHDREGPRRGDRKSAGEVGCAAKVAHRESGRAVV